MNNLIVILFFNILPKTCDIYIDYYHKSFLLLKEVN